MTVALRALGLDAQRWQRVEPRSVVAALPLAAAASVGFAWNRFGGLVVDAPRSFVRLTLIGVWGWVALSVAIWVLLNIACRVTRRPGRGDAPASLLRLLAVAGFAHIPLTLLALVIFVAAGLAEILGPGLVVAVFALGFWVPALLIAGTKHTEGVGLPVATVAALVPYAVWLVTVGRHLLEQVQHLL